MQNSYFASRFPRAFRKACGIRFETRQAADRSSSTFLVFFCHFSGATASGSHKNVKQYHEYHPPKDSGPSTGDPGFFNVSCLTGQPQASISPGRNPLEILADDNLRRPGKKKKKGHRRLQLGGFLERVPTLTRSNRRNYHFRSDFTTTARHVYAGHYA